MKKLYVDTGHGQVHARILAAAGDETEASLLCLHPAPSSGLYFTNVMPRLNANRTVVAPDYPGYGGSDALPGEPSICDFAVSMHRFLDGIDREAPFDVLGFHTGCLVAVEMALQKPEAIRRLLLCDIPFFPEDQRAPLKKKLAQPLAVSPALDSLADAWRFSVSGRLDDVPLDRAFELFVEHLRAGTGDALAFAAAFSYDCDAAFAALRADVTCLATASGLHDATVAAAAAIPGARLVDVPEVTAAVFEAGADNIARRIGDAL